MTSSGCVHHLSFGSLGWYYGVFRHTMLVTDRGCRHLLCEEKMRKYLKISLKPLLFQIFFVYLPAFVRVKTPCVCV